MTLKFDISGHAYLDLDLNLSFEYCLQWLIIICAPTTDVTWVSVKYRPQKQTTKILFFYSLRVVFTSSLVNGLSPEFDRQIVSSNSRTLLSILADLYNVVVG